MPSDENNEEIRMYQSIDKNTKEIAELEQKLNTMTKFESHFRDSSDHYKNVHIPLSNRIEALEKHDIFRIWSSLRTGGKTTLDAILKDNARIKQLGKQIAELQQKVSNPEWLDILILDLIKLQMTPLEETLRKHLKEHLYLGVLQKTPELTEEGLLSYWNNTLREELEKLEAKDASSASHTEKKEKMTDDEIMRFNEELMAKIHKREVQPLEKEPTDDIPYEKDMTIYNGYAYNPTTNIIVKKADLERWKGIIRDYMALYSVWTVGFEEITADIEKYLKEKEDADES